MILTDEMLAAAFRYRESKLWFCLDDSNIFAFRLSDGEIGYCCVMGHAGEHLSLGFYRGAHQFNTYLKTIRMGELSSAEALELSMTFDCIHCDFMSAAKTQGLDKAAKEQVRKFAKDNGVQMRRPNAWPDFIRYAPYQVTSPITDEQDAKDITEALNAAVVVADRLEAWTNDIIFNDELYGACGFDLKYRYPTQSGGKSVPFLIPQGDGTYEWSMTRLPAAAKDVFPATEYDNMIVAARLRSMTHRGILQCKVIHLPILAAQQKEPHKGYFPSVLLCVQEDSQYVFPVMTAVSVEEDPLQTLNSFAKALLDIKVRPSTISVSDAKTKALMADFCKKTGIRLQTVRKMPELENAWNYMAMCNF